MKTAITLLAIALAGLMAGCNSLPSHESTVVQFSDVVIKADLEDLPPSMQFKVKLLEAIDPANPMESYDATQTLSLFGREDLIPATSRDYRAIECTPHSLATDPLDAIALQARKTSIVIINESHEQSRHRAFTAKLAARLRPLGYDTLGLEALINSPAETPEESLPAFTRIPDQPFLQDDDGHYVSEATFGRLGREAKRLGYRLLAYEADTDDGLGLDADRDERIAAREEEQATNLATFIAANPEAKLLVHVGYSHAMEVPGADGKRWMATRLKAKTGIDPLTISQTTCRGGGEIVRLDQLPNDEISGTFDVVIDHPLVRYDQSRPTWRAELGDVATTIPAHLRPVNGWRIIEARPFDETVNSVPLDRVAIRPTDDVALMLPPGRYQLRLIDVPLGKTGGADYTDNPGSEKN